MSVRSVRPCRAHRLRRRILFGAAAAALWLLYPCIASAHAHLVQADPAPGAVIARAPSVASFVFDEALNPTLTRVRITTSSGRAVTADAGHLAPGHGGELWQLRLPPLAPGTYSVFWTSESAVDGHVMSSFYTFRVAPSGGAADLGGVAATGGGMGGRDPAGSGPTFDAGAAAITLFVWLGLMAQALWLGALVVELAVLAPARRAAGPSEARLAWAAAPRLWRLARAAPPVVLAALLGEVLSLALVGTGGDWARALAPATLGGMLSSQNGALIVLRIVALLVAIRLTGGVRAPASARVRGRSSWWPRPIPQALGITASLPAPLRLDWEAARLPAAILAAGYMALVACSGHAANVAPAIVWQSCAVDWLHLVCTAAWAGGIAALAYGVLPARHAFAPAQRAPAVLPLLDRFSPVAYLAVGTLALSGWYSAAHHLDTPAELAGTLYGQLLVLKMGLVGLLIALSGSHVVRLRPRIARAQRRSMLDPLLDGTAGEVATVHEGLATLASCLRLEAGVGAAILLITALMSQTLPAGAAASMPMSAPRATAAAISGVAATGDLRAQLTIAPPAVGAAAFTLHLWEQGAPLTDNDAAAIIHLFPASQPSLRASLTPAGSGTRFAARGSLAESGAWRAEVLVRTASVDTYRTLRFAFTVGPGASFLARA